MIKMIANVAKQNIIADVVLLLNAEIMNQPILALAPALALNHVPLNANQDQDHVQDQDQDHARVLGNPDQNQDPDPDHVLDKDQYQGKDPKEDADNVNNKIN